MMPKKSPEKRLVLGKEIDTYKQQGLSYAQLVNQLSAPMAISTARRIHLEYLSHELEKDIALFNDTSDLIEQCTYTKPVPWYKKLWNWLTL